MRKRIARWMSCEPSEITRQRMRAWLAHVPGRWFQAEQRAQLAEVLPTLFGYHLLQVGDLYSRECLTSSRIPNCMVLDDAPQDTLPARERPRARMRGVPECLPIATDSIDVVLLSHALEFADNPHQVLREVERVLIPEGHVVVLGFNPWSPWLLWRLALGWRGRPPWCGRVISLIRLKDWLKLLGFDVVECRRYFFRPPLSQKGIMRRLRFLDRIGRRWLPFFGAGYIVVARKRVATLTPLKTRWRPARGRVPRPGLAGNSRALGGNRGAARHESDKD